MASFRWTVFALGAAILIAQVTFIQGAICPDHYSTCLDNQTCCETAPGRYGCCNSQNAVCCANKKSCCPQGFRCDDEHRTCVNLDDYSTIRPMTIKEENTIDRSNQMCPGSEQECDDSATCCNLGSGKWGCCPYDDATCCSDGIHCCPDGYDCDLTTQSCVSKSLNDLFYDLFGREPARAEMKKIETKVKSSEYDIVCPGGEYECPTDTTCCPVGGGDYGCCPMPNAVCCSDQTHCCPEGTECDGQVCLRSP